MSSAPTLDPGIGVSEDQVRFFRENGYLHLEGVAAEAELAWLREVFDSFFRRARGAFPGGYFDTVRPYDSEGAPRLPQVLMPELAVPALRETAFHRAGRRIAAALLGAAAEELESWSHMLEKPAGIGHETPWHQDEAYWDPGFDYRALGIWLPLDPASVESGCLHFVPGSHRGPVRRHRHLHDDPRVHALVTDEVDETLARAVPVAAGGATVHHCRTLHFAGPNGTGHTRRAWSIVFQTPKLPRARRAERPWFDEMEAALEERAR